MRILKKRFLKFSVPGEPKGKARPKVNTYTHKAVTPYQTKAYENAVMWSFQEDCKGEEPIEGPVFIKINAFFGIPKSASKKMKADMKSGAIRPTKKPDADNIAKIICDALNGIAYHDDAAIVDLFVSKWYSMDPRVEVEIWEANGNENREETT